MRILTLGKFYHPHHGGIERLLSTWCEGFVKRGAEVDCAVANHGVRTVHDVVNGVRVHRFASFGMALSTSLAPGYLSAGMRFKADLVHVHFPNPLADLATFLIPARVPVVLTYHSDIVRQDWLMRLYRPSMEKLLKRSARIIVATPLHFEYSPWLQPHAQKVECIPFGIDTARYRPSPAISAASAALREKAGGRPILLNVGRLVGYKGQENLLAAARDLNAEVWFVGSGPLLGALQAYARESRLGDRCRFWGSVEDADLPAFFHACDVFVLPSVTPNEAFGLVQLEAMACGKPVISTALRSGVPFVNRHEVTGLIVQPGDVAGLRQAIERLLGKPDLAAHMGRAGRDRVVAEFTDELMVSRYWDCFETVLATRTAVDRTGTFPNPRSRPRLAASDASSHDQRRDPFHHDHS